MPKILIVDDDQMITKVMSHYFQDMGYTVSIVNSGEEALQYLNNQTTEYLITDLRLPGITGLVLLQTVLPAHPTIKCILMSGALDFDIPDQLIKLGITAKNLIQKPEKLSVILQTLTEL